MKSFTEPSPHDKRHTQRRESRFVISLRNSQLLDVEAFLALGEINLAQLSRSVQ